MVFIGIINNKSNKIFLEDMLKETINDNFKIINLTSENIVNFRNIKFDILIINYVVRFKNYIKEIVNNSKNILINSDVNIDLGLFNKIDAYVITYGYNKRATVTIVSCEQDDIILDIQREIRDINQVSIESGEMKIITKYPKRCLYEEVVCNIIEKICGKN